MPHHAELFQQQLIHYSAPTLGCMKVGSLFNIKTKDYPNYNECIDYFNEILCQYHLKVCTIKKNTSSILIYVYHESKLKALLSQPNIQSFLMTYGYHSFSVEEILSHLTSRIKNQEFPHEIGVFLGYPLYDVIHFILNDKACKKIGYWKVYGNKKNSQKIFDRFDCCRNEMIRLVNTGENIESILSKVS